MVAIFTERSSRASLWAVLTVADRRQSYCVDCRRRCKSFHLQSYEKVDAIYMDAASLSPLSRVVFYLKSRIILKIFKKSP